MGTAKRELTLDGLHCAACAAKMEERLKGLEGVTSVFVNFAEKKLIVETDKVEELDRVAQEVKRLFAFFLPDVVVEEKNVDCNTKKAFLLMGLDCAQCASKIEN